MTIAVVGANGQLGCDIIKELLANSISFLDLTEREIDITNKESIFTTLDQLNFDTIINCAAYTNVENCENDEILAFNVNAIGVKYLAEYARIHEKTIYHISTDYVFDGTKGSPYIENDIPSPINVYGLSKLSGEILLKNYCDRYVILRTSGLYGHAPSITKKYNFVELMLNKAKNNEKIMVVNDEFVSPTYTVDLARQIIHILKNNIPYGIYHAVCDGSCSWFDFATKIFEIMKIRVDIAATSASAFKAKVKRPAYSVLENKKLTDLNSNIMRRWDVALADYLNYQLS